MKRPVQWSQKALNDIKHQVKFISKDNPDAARRVADQIRDTGTALGAIATGRPGRVSGTYEKSVRHLPYIIVYALSERAGRKDVVILHVIHTARDWPAKDWPREFHSTP